MSKWASAMLLLAAALASGAWVAKRAPAAGSSVTVKLPPARPAPPHPGFAFERS